MQILRVELLKAVTDLMITFSFLEITLLRAPMMRIALRRCQIKCPRSKTILVLAFIYPAGRKLVSLFLRNMPWRYWTYSLSRWFYAKPKVSGGLNFGSGFYVKAYGVVVRYEF